MRQRSAAVIKFLSGQKDELVILVGAGLVTYGLWPVVGQAALVVPGAVMLWIGVPTRRRFVEREQAPQPARRAS